MIKSVTSILEKVRDDNNLIVTIPKVCEGGYFYFV